MYFCKKLWAMLVMIAILVFGSVITTSASTPDGYFDAIDGNTPSISGWGWDSSRPSISVLVQISVKNQDTGEVIAHFSPVADTYRSDLSASGIGNAVHGFSVEMDWEALPVGNYIIEGSVEGKAFANTQTYTKKQSAGPGIEQAEAEEAAVPEESVVLLGVFRTTGYCPCYECSEGWGRKTSTGATARSGHTIAVDPRVIPYGSQIMIDGVIYTAEDRGGAVKGQHIDIFFDTHAETLKHGSRMQEVYLVK